MSEAAATAGTSEKIQALLNWTMHHVQDSQAWHLPGGLVIHFPPWISLHAVMLLIVAGLMVLVFGKVYRKGPAAPTGATNLLEIFVVFIRDQVATMCLGKEDGRRYTPLLCTYFFFVAFCNLLGLIPLFATATGNISVTFALATTSLGMILIGGLLKNGPVGFVKSFLPHGVPWPILLIVGPLEFVGVFIKCFALMVRLFANMLAGHIVIFCILGLIFVFGYTALPAVFLALAIFLMEIFIALLQAYIFTLLSAMFMGLVWHPAH